MHRILRIITCLVALSGTAIAGGNEQRLKPISFAALNSWDKADQAAAYTSFVLSCQEILKKGAQFKAKPRYAGQRSDWLPACRKAVRSASLSNADARRFFERNFVLLQISGDQKTGSLFTGYYEPEVAGSLVKTPDFRVPIYAKPADLVKFTKAQRTASGLRFGRLVGGKPKPYLTRKQIEQGALAGKGLELAWLKSPQDAFFMQVQGSGRIKLPDGKVKRVGYAAKSGLPYTPIGAVLIKWGEVAREDMSMQAIRHWMDTHPERATELMWHNESFVFFRPVQLQQPDLGPVGAQQVQLRPMSSLAIDRSYWAYGTPMWLETVLPAVTGHKAQAFHNLMIAQDTGTAIRGLVRGDIFFGAGHHAAQLAGKMQSAGTLYALLPRPAARRLGFGN